MNSRAKGSRTFRKAVRYALSYHGTVVIPIYQVSQWAQQQPFDAILLRQDYLARLVEVRSNSWGVSKASTRQLSGLPGIVIKQIWRFYDREITPEVREWNGNDWVWKENPWESE